LQQPFAKRELVGGRHPGQGVQERVGGGRCADLAQGPCGRLGHVVVCVTQQLGEKLDGSGVAAHTNAAYYADERPALEFACRLAQGLIHR
jgi:hypothetical protein